LDVDENETAANFGVMSIPTVIVFKGGKAMEVDGKPVREVGFRGEAGYRAMLEAALK
jgi:thioredoxin-like negative regulator of GroEL